MEEMEGRTFTKYVSSETIKKRADVDELSAYFQMGYGIILLKNNKDVGYIDFHCDYLGSDVIIKSIVVRNDTRLSEELTKRYKGKIIIFSEFDLVS